MVFDITISDAEPGRVALSGELDLSAVAAIDDAVDRALSDPKAGVVVLDLARATFLDSSALGALVRGRRTATAGGRRLVVVNAHGHVQRVLEITGVASVLTDGAVR